MLIQLELQNNQIGDVGARYLADQLFYNKVLFITILSLVLVFCCLENTLGVHLRQQSFTFRSDPIERAGIQNEFVVFM